MEILIVDDSVIIRNKMAKLLSDIKAISKVYTSEGGHSAYELLSKCKPELILTDIRMPAGDGFELAQKVKSEMPQIKVIFYTSYDFEEFRDKAKKIGVDHFFNKWKETKNLISTIVDISNGNI
ncbi:MAG: response regulator [Bacteroidota bacterium]|nr:response regulator [Bacteroidota bacterium]